MNTEFFKRPILNSPYEYPGRHWELDESGQPTSQIIDRRRRVSFITPIPKPKKRGQREIVFDELEEPRPSTLVFHLTKRLLETKWRDPRGAPKLHLFGQLKRVTRQWWEAEFCRVAEVHPRVRAYIEDHGLGLEVPYRSGAESRTCVPDLIVLVEDGRVNGMRQRFGEVDVHEQR